MVVIDEEVYLAHVGIIRRSGRYPWGSGKEGVLVVHNNQSFMDWIKELTAKGFSKKEIADGLGVSTTTLVAQRSISSNEIYASNVVGANALKAKGMSNKEIGIRMGQPGKPIGESTIRSWLKPAAEVSSSALQSTADMLKRQVEEKGVIDVGLGVESGPSVGVSKDRMKTAVTVLTQQGYKKYSLKIPQQGTGKMTDMVVLARPEFTQKQIWQNPELIRLIDEHSEDGGRSFLGIKPPLSIDPKRLQIIHGDEGGDRLDGVVHVRPDVKDVALGGQNYAQVRIQVGDGHFIKGMAVYKDDLPPGIDIQFNTNKTRAELGGDKLKALKPLKTKEDGTIDKDNPFGTVIKRQILADPDDKNSPVSSSMNLVYEAGNWSDWSKTIASQVLSKQEPKVAKSQLDATLKRREEEYAEIMSLTNPAVRQKLLKEFSDEADSASVHLKAAGFKRQGWHVILPVDTLKETEIYAPTFRDGETVALIRYPHGGTFEIPELRVNNSHAPAIKMIGSDTKDAVGIHHSVAERLSGADFDGDTVLVIPNNNRQIKSTPALEGLKNFKPREAYPKFDGMKVMSNTQAEMGKISNLITDMQLRGAPLSDVTKAVRHSMVVIDAEKHELNYRESEKREGIKALKEKYQQGGASTLISRAKSQVYYDNRKDRPASLGGPIDPVTGEKRYVPTNELKRTRVVDPVTGEKSYVTTGELRRTRGQALAETTNAHDLSSGTRVEVLYADYSNSVKALANRARLDMLNTPNAKYNKTAKATYQNEVDELNSALVIAQANAPRERRAQILAGTYMKAYRQENPSADEAILKKRKGQALTEARARTGAGKDRIKITPQQWDAIQAGAISHSKLTDILNHSDMDVVKSHATPRTQTLMTPAKSSKAKGLLAAGNTRAQVADQLGVSLSTLDASL